jgi:hypothetical protein
VGTPTKENKMITLRNETGNVIRIAPDLIHAQPFLAMGYHIEKTEKPQEELRTFIIKDIFEEEKANG